MQAGSHDLHDAASPVVLHILLGLPQEEDLIRLLLCSIPWGVGSVASECLGKHWIRCRETYSRALPITRADPTRSAEPRAGSLLTVGVFNVALVLCIQGFLLVLVGLVKNFSLNIQEAVLVSRQVCQQGGGGGH